MQSMDESFVQCIQMPCIDRMTDICLEVKNEINIDKLRVYAVWNSTQNEKHVANNVNNNIQTQSKVANTLALCQQANKSEPKWSRGYFEEKQNYNPG